MGSCCGRNTPRNNPTDKRGNSLRKYAYLHPNQRKILEAEEAAKEAEKKEEETEEEDR